MIYLGWGLGERVGGGRRCEGYLGGGGGALSGIRVGDTFVVGGSCGGYMGVRGLGVRAGGVRGGRG